MTDKLKILIVDDSRVFRSIIEEAMKGEVDLQVIGSVRNGEKAIEFIKSSPPDLVTLDVEMPEMDGLETLEAIHEINASNPDRLEIGVIMVSAFTSKGADITIKALQAGAFDFITKPEGKDVAENISSLRSQLLVKIRHFAVKRISSMVGRSVARSITTPFRRPLIRDARPKIVAPPIVSRHTTGIKAVLIGVSTGGPRALADMLPELSEKVNLPFFIVQHMPPTFTQSLANSLDATCRHRVIEALDNDPVQDGYIYIAPGGSHMLMHKDRMGRVVTILNQDPPENGCRPSVDVLFRSAVDVYGGDMVAIILTGMGADGTKGLGLLKLEGAYAIVQDKETSIVWGMPGSAVEAGYADEILPLNKIPDAVMWVIQKKRG